MYYHELTIIYLKIPIKRRDKLFILIYKYLNAVIWQTHASKTKDL